MASITYSFTQANGTLSGGGWTPTNSPQVRSNRLEAKVAGVAYSASNNTHGITTGLNQWEIEFYYDVRGTTGAGYAGIILTANVTTDFQGWGLLLADNDGAGASQSHIQRFDTAGTHTNITNEGGNPLFGWAKLRRATGDLYTHWNWNPSTKTWDGPIDGTHDATGADRTAGTGVHFQMMTDTPFGFGSSATVVMDQITIRDFHSSDPPGLDQEGFRWRNDDGSETTATWKESQDVDASVALDTNVRLRMLLDSPTGVAWGAQVLQLQYKLDSEADTEWRPIGSGTRGSTPTIVGWGTASLTTNDPSVNLSSGSWVPATGDIVVLEIASTTALNAAATAPSGWANAMGDDWEVSQSTHGIACFYHVVTSGEAGGSTTFTATDALAAAETGNVVGYAIRGVNPLNPVNAVGFTQNASSVTPHVMAALTLQAQPSLSNCLITRGVAKDATGSYTTPAGHTSITSSNSNLIHQVWTRDAATTAGSDVAAVNVTPDGAEQYVSLTIAWTPRWSASSEIVTALSSQYVDGAATTAQLTAPSGKTSGADFDAGVLVEGDFDANSVTFTTDGYTEVEWCLKATSPAVNTDVYQFRVTEGDVVLPSYTLIPELTIGGAITQVVDTATLTLAGQTPTAAGTGNSTKAVDTATFTLVGQDVTAIVSEISLFTIFEDDFESYTDGQAYLPRADWVSSQAWYIFDPETTGTPLEDKVLYPAASSTLIYELGFIGGAVMEANVNVSASSSPGLIVGYADSNNYLRLDLNVSGDILYLTVFVSGSPTVLDSQGSMTWTEGQFSLFRLELDDNGDARGYFDDVETVSATLDGGQMAALGLGAGLYASGQPEFGWMRGSVYVEPGTIIVRPAALTLSGQTPNIPLNAIIDPAALALTGQSPTPVSPIVQTVEPATLTLTAIQPEPPLFVTVDPAAFTLTGQTPDTAFYFEDDFNRADGAIGNGWVDLTGSPSLPSIDDNRVVAPVPGALYGAVRPETYGDYQYAEVTGELGADYSEILVFTKFTVGEDGYLMTWVTDGATASGGSIEGPCHQIWRGDGTGLYELLWEAPASTITGTHTVKGMYLDGRLILFMDDIKVGDIIDPDPMVSGVGAPGLSVHQGASGLTWADDYKAGEYLPDYLPTIPGPDLTETWTGSNGAAWPAGWTQISTLGTTSATIEGNKGQQSVAGGPGFRTDMKEYFHQDFDLRTSMTITSGQDAQPRVYFRRSTNGLRVSLVNFNTASNNITIEYSTDGASTTIVDTGAFTYATGTYQIRVRAVGTTVVAKIWEDGDPEPVAWNVQGTVVDATGSANQIGFAMLRLTSGTAVVQWDDLAIQGLDSLDPVTATVDPAVLTLVGVEPSQTGALNQEGFRWRNDNGDEDGATWKAAQDTDIELYLGTSARLRVLLDASGDPPPIPYKLHYKKSGDSIWLPVPVDATSSSGLPAPLLAYNFSESGTTVIDRSGEGRDATMYATSTPTDLHSSGEFAPTVSGHHLAYDATSDAAAVPTVMSFTCKLRTLSSTGEGVLWSRMRANDSTGVRISYAANRISYGLRTEPFGIHFGDNGTNLSNNTTYQIAFTYDGATIRLYIDGTEVHTNTDPTGDLNQDGNKIWKSGYDVDVGFGTFLPFIVDDIRFFDVVLTAGEVEIAADTPVSVPPIYIVPSSNITSGGEATTAQLTPPSGKTTGNFVTGRMWDDENGTDSIDVTANSYTELEWSLANQAPAADDEIYQFRVYNGDDELGGYTITPQLTITTTAVTQSVDAATLTLTGQTPSSGVPTTGIVEPAVLRLVGQNPVADGQWDPGILTDLDWWLDASDTASFTLSGSAVMEWGDLSGNGFDAVEDGTAGHRPQRNATIGSLTAVAFDGGDILNSTASADRKPFTFAATFNATSDVNPRAFFGSQDSDGWEAVLNTSGQFALFYNGVEILAEGAIPEDTPTLLVFTYADNGVWSLRVDGAETQSGTDNVTVTPGNLLTIGGDGAATHGFTGSIGEMIYCDAVLSTEEIGFLEYYLLDKWEPSTVVADPAILILAGQTPGTAVKPFLVAQEGFRWRNDNGSETTATWRAAQDTDSALVVGQKARLRVLVDATVGDPDPSAYTLYYKKTTDSTWLPVAVEATTNHVWTGATPTAATDSASYNLGTYFSLFSAQTLVGIRIWNPGLVTVTGRIANLWSATNTSGAGATLLRTIDISDLLPTGWSEHLFSTPYSATTGIFYCVSYFVDGGGTGPTSDYGAVTGGLSSPVVNGQFSIDVGRYVATATPGVIPTSATNAFYGVDILYGGVTTDPVYIATSANITAGGQATTAQLTPPTGKTTADFSVGRMWDDENGTDTVDI